MKTYTLLEAMKEIKHSFPLFNTDNITCLYYPNEQDKCKIVAVFDNRDAFKILFDLDDFTYTRYTT